jgi:hypothetical protein
MLNFANSLNAKKNLVEQTLSFPYYTLTFPSFTRTIFGAIIRPFSSHRGNRRRDCRNYLGGIGGRYLPGGIVWRVWSPLSGGSIRRTHVFRLILLNQSVASLRHAGARRFIRRSSVKIGMAKGDVSLALLK